MTKKLEIKCWVAIDEEMKDFIVCSTRKQAKEAVFDMRGFDLDPKIRKAVLIITLKTTNTM